MGRGCVVGDPEVSGGRMGVYKKYLGAVQTVRGGRFVISLLK